MRSVAFHPASDTNNKLQTQIEYTTAFILFFGFWYVTIFNLSCYWYFFQAAISSVHHQNIDISMEKEAKETKLIQLDVSSVDCASRMR